MLDSIENKHIREALAEALPGAIFRKARRDSAFDNVVIDLVMEVQYHELVFRLIIGVIHRLGFSSAHLRDKAYQAKDYSRKLKGSAIPMIVAPYLSPRHQDVLREQGVAFLDLSGNVFLQYDSINVDRRGFRNLFREERSVRDPFSDKASLALRVLLESDRSWGLRELAQAANMSPGYTSKVVSRLEELGYVSRGREGIGIRDARSMLDDWVADYSKKSKGRQKFRKYFCRANSPLDVMSEMATLEDSASEAKYALSLHAGAHLVEQYASFEIVDMYVADLEMQSFFVSGLDMRSVEKGENVRFISPYYKESVFYGARRLGGLWVVSDLQLYLDLYDYPIRGREQAERIYQKRLKNVVKR